MAGFREERIQINGVDVAMLTAGAGAPLVFWHGAGTFTGFDFALPWASHFKVIIPFHPGFGRSGDDASITSMQDYIIHYRHFFDRLGLDQVNLVGFSMGGWMAARFAVEHSDRLRKLVLVAPAGLPVAEEPTVDLLGLAPQDLPPLLASNLDVVLRHLPKGEDPLFAAAGKREMESLARIAPQGPNDKTLPGSLRQIKVPTLIVWGTQDRLIPVGQLAHWARLLPDATTRTFDAAGHLLLDESPAAVTAVGDFLR